MSSRDEKSKVFGRALASARKNANFSNQGKLAEVLGMAKNTVWHYEAGRTLPDIDFLARFARATGADLQELVALRLQAAGEDPALLKLHEAPADYGPSLLHQQLTEDRAEAFAGRRAGEPRPGEIAAAVRREVERAGVPIRWGLLLVQLAAVGDLTVNGARFIIDMLSGDEQDRHGSRENQE